MKARHYLLTTAALLIAGTAHAQVAPAPADTAANDTAQTDAAPAPDQGQDIVVTGVAQGRNRLDTSISVSSLDADLTSKIPPRNTAEILRNLPGVRVEASGGEGNANISVRGLPVASGGSDRKSVV